MLRWNVAIVWPGLKTYYWIVTNPVYSVFYVQITGTKFIVLRNRHRLCWYLIQAIKRPAVLPLYTQGCHTLKPVVGTTFIRYNMTLLRTNKSLPLVKKNLTYKSGYQSSTGPCSCYLGECADMLIFFLVHAGWKPYGLCPGAYYRHGRYAVQSGLLCVRCVLSVLVSCWSTAGENYYHR